jgi:hypothetical protein
MTTAVVTGAGSGMGRERVDTMRNYADVIIAVGSDAGYLRAVPRSSLFRGAHMLRSGFPR